MARTYPPVSFYFEVTFEGSEFDNETEESSFQSVTGLSVDMQTETLKEGGENRFEHILPVRTKYNPLVLKRGVLKSSKLVKWCQNAILYFNIQPINLIVHLLHVEGESATQSPEKKKPLMSWKVINAWPKKWSISDFNAEQNAIAIETLELSYSYFELTNSG